MMRHGKKLSLHNKSDGRGNGRCVKTYQMIYKEGYKTASLLEDLSAIVMSFVIRSIYFHEVHFMKSIKRSVNHGL